MRPKKNIGMPGLIPSNGIVAANPADAIVRAFGISTGGVISFVGAGGKTSLIKSAAEALKNKFRVAVTTTTRVYPFGIGFKNYYFNSLFARDAFKSAESEGFIPAVFSSLDSEGKCVPLSNSDFRELAASVDVLLVEADGARGCSLKIPREHEPVIHPLSKKAVWVMGLDVLCDPFDSKIIFHPEMFQYFDFYDGETLTSENLRNIIYAENGYLDKLRGIETYLCLNKSDLIPAGDMQNLRRLFHNELAGILVSSCANGRFTIRPLDNSNIGVDGILLCAGASERFGSNKLLADCGGQPLFMHALRSALESRLEKIHVVMDGRAPEIINMIQSLKSDGIIPVVLSGGEPAMSRSLRAGLESIIKNNASVGETASMAMLGDMPNVSATLINSVLDAFAKSAASIAAPFINGKRGHPVVFHPDLFSELMEIRGDLGGRLVADKYADMTKNIETNDGKSQTDIDAPSDMEIGNALIL
jgi:molybdenum cofactor cytidylyltransferase